MAKQQTFTFSMSKFVESFFYLNGKPYSLEDYPHMKIIYDIDPQYLVLKTSRQVSKSTFLAIRTLANSIIMPQAYPKFSGGFKTLYVAPTVEQVRIFSHERVAPVIEQTPLIKHHYLHSALVQNVFQRRFVNGSTMFLRYGGTTADRIRGISADMNCMDEVQDLPNDNIEVAELTMARSLYKHVIYAGTPKRNIGSLASRWKRSTQNEWMPKCASCNKYNYLDEKNIQEWGLACRYCFHSLSPKNGTWVRTNDSSVKNKNTGAYLWEGFRVSVLQFANAEWVDWQRDVYLPFTTKPKAIFFNEYLGLEHDEGVSPITENEIKACCTGGPMLKEPNSASQSYAINIGIDWGPVNSQNSRTVLSILQRKLGITHVLYLKRFEGHEADFAFMHDEVPKIYNLWKAQLIGADYGFGEAANSEIRRRLSDVRKLISFQHVPNQKQPMNWNHNMQSYTLGRNKMMTELFQKIKKRQIVFPCWEDFQPFAKDILAIAIDYDEEHGKYKYINSEPDDTFHSILYGDIACFLYEKAMGGAPSYP